MRRKFYALFYLFIMVEAAAIFMFSAFGNFDFFVDSKTYITGGAGYYVFYLISRLHPLNVLAVFFFCMTWISKVLKRFPTDPLAYLIFMNPYLYLLITNYTKEGLILASLFGWLSFQFFNPKLIGAIGQFLCVVAIIAIRPIYIIWIYLIVIGDSIVRSLFFVFLMIVSLLVILTVHSVDEYIYIIQEHGYSRSIIDHLGRDYFNYLCVAEKVDFGLFAKCATWVFFLLPLHSDAFSANYIVFLFFQGTNIYLLYRIFKKYNFLVSCCLFLAFYTCYITTFFLSPTFGAFNRYFLPFTWLFYFYFFLRVPKIYTKRKFARGLP